MRTIKDQAAIVGIGATEFSKNSGRSSLQLAAEAVQAAKARGLTIPIVYNTNGYDAVDALRQIRGLVDIYLPDIKYLDNSLGRQFSAARDYADVIPGVRVVKGFAREAEEAQRFDRRSSRLFGHNVDVARKFVDDCYNKALGMKVLETLKPGDVLTKVVYDELVAMMERLERLKDLEQHWIKLHTFENEGDQIFREAVGELFASERDAIELVKWKDLYERIEIAIDRCEDIANIVETIKIKHS